MSGLERPGFRGLSEDSEISEMSFIRSLIEIGFRILMAVSIIF